MTFEKVWNEKEKEKFLQWYNDSKLSKKQWCKLTGVPRTTLIRWECESKSKITMDTTMDTPILKETEENITYPRVVPLGMTFKRS